MTLLDVQAAYESQFFQQLMIRRRRARARFFLSKVRTFPGMTVLDVGCGTDGNSLEIDLPSHSKVVGVDILDPSEVKIRNSNFTYVRQDAEDLTQFGDQQFDLAVSVGMMEHICDQVKLNRMAAEMRRVSKQLVIVVPWRYAWIEPHFKLPLFQLLPFFAQRWLAKTMNSQNYADFVKRDPDGFRTHFYQNYQWLPTSKWKEVFGASKACLSPTLETIAIIRS
jgi:ubiquinone/menaquinone biosynthesis C-methylase UbiE